MNQYGKINLLKLFGSYVTADANGRNVVVIPCDYNDITIYQSQQTGKIVSADLSINTIELSDDARMKASANNASRDNYIPPTHFVKLGMSKECFNERFAGAANKQMQQHPEWVGFGFEQKLPDGRYNPLYTAVNNVLHPILGELRQSGSSLQPLSGSVQQGGFVPPQQDEDLPF